MGSRNKLDPRNWSNLPEWEELPEFMKNEEVRPYYDILKKHRNELKVKRTLELIMAWILLAILSIPMLVIAIIIKLDSPGPVFYRQERVTTYGKIFRIHKFRTMIQNADKIGSAVTVSGDNRITKAGRRLRKLRLDEIAQLFDVIEGTMSFVGTRPEAVKYVKKYSSEMMATLLLPAGIASEASIKYKNEAILLDSADNVDKVYIEKVLPEKMKWNLKSIQKFSIFKDIETMIRTVIAVVR